MAPRTAALFMSRSIGRRCRNCRASIFVRITVTLFPYQRVYQHLFLISLLAPPGQGTTNSRCMIFDQQKTMITITQKEHQQIYPHPGWIEHDPQEIWQCVQKIITLTVQKNEITINKLTTIDVTNQRESIVV